MSETSRCFMYFAFLCFFPFLFFLTVTLSVFLLRCVPPFPFVLTRRCVCVLHVEVNSVVYGATHYAVLSAVRNLTVAHFLYHAPSCVSFLLDFHNLCLPSVEDTYVVFICLSVSPGCFSFYYFTFIFSFLFSFITFKLLRATLVTILVFSCS